MLLPETEINDAAQIAELIRESVEGLKLENRGAIEDVVTVSIGVTRRIPTRDD